MTRFERGLWRALPLLVACAALAPSFSGAEEAAEPPAQGRSIVSGKDIILYPADAGASSFRFLPGGSYIPYDRSLVLSAAAGERRSYLLQIDPTGAGSETAPVFGYVIDKRRPQAPRAAPGTGLFREAILPVLSAEEGASIYWTLVGPGVTPSSFAALGESSRPEARPPSTGTATYALLAYAVDSSGNRSYPSRFIYRLAEPRIPADAPVPDFSALKTDPSLPKPEVDSALGYSLVRMSVPSNASLLLDIAPEAPPSSLDDFERVAPESGVAKLRIPCPYGWAGDLIAYYGILKDGLASYNPQSISIHVSNPADEVPRQAAPEGPILAADPAGRAAFAVFPSYDGALFVSVEGSDPAPYDSPIALPLDKRSVRISWYGEDASGRRSVSRNLSLALPEALPDIELAGIREGAVVGGDVTLKPMAKANLRYEISLDGSIPPEPGPSSPLFGDSLAITCPDGEERSVTLRYRVISGLTAGEGRILRFSIDRKPPEAPRLTSMPSPYTDKPTILSLVPGSGGKDVYASISADGHAAPFALVTGSLELAGSDEEPVSYVLRAYDTDVAGNRSPEMKSLSIIVDRSSVYVAEDGSDKGDGSPDKPYKSLDAALASAMKAGKKNINMRGSLEMTLPFACSSEIGLSGGFDRRWNKDSQTRAHLRVAVPRGQSAFSFAGGSLLLRRLDIAAEAAGDNPFIAISDASLSVSDSSILAKAEGDVVLVSALRSKVDMSGSRIAASRAMACTVFSAEMSDIAVASSSFSASKDVRVFGAFDLDGGSLSLGESLVESRADLGLNVMSLRSATLLVDRCLIKADDGSGFLRIGSFDAVRGEVKNSKVFASWKGSGVLFEISRGGPAFRHDTIVADSAREGMRFFDVKGEAPQIWNSILECSGKESELLRSDSGAGPGVLVADCVWGFDKLLAGAQEARDVASLNALNAGSSLYSYKPIVSESPERSFAAPIKSMAPLRADSACVNAAMPLDIGYDVDFSGRRRPEPGKPTTGSDRPLDDAPDIGADELVG
jgi:hypothetical protein